LISDYGFSVLELQYGPGARENLTLACVQVLVFSGQWPRPTGRKAPKFEIAKTRMALELSCPYCSKAMKLADSAAGLTVKCPRCGNRLKVAVDQEGTTSFEEGYMVVEETPCPCCRGALPLGAGVCAHCGYDLETRKRPVTYHEANDEVEVVGSKFLGTYTEFVFRHDAFEGWLLFIDSRESSLSTWFAKLVLRECAEAWINYFQVSADSGSMNLDVIDRSSHRRRVYSGDSSAMEWLINRLRKSGLEIKRV
jgi:phage FluMu protein Com